MRYLPQGWLWNPFDMPSVSDSVFRGKKSKAQKIYEARKKELEAERKKNECSRGIEPSK